MTDKPDDDMASNLTSALTAALQNTFKSYAQSPLSLLGFKVAWDSALFAEEHIASARLFYSLGAMHDYVMETIPPTGLICEFGVHKGKSINRFAEKLVSMGQEHRKIYGFDSFEGFSEEWTGSSVGIKGFDQGGQMPEVAPSIELIKGYIEDTYGKFLKRPEIQDQRIAFLHIDADTYSPAKTALMLSCDRFDPGTIIQFDDFYGYPGWRHHEYRALIETAEERGFAYSFIGFAHRQATIRIDTVRK